MTVAQAIVHAGKVFSPRHRPDVPDGDISAVLVIMHHIRSLAPIQITKKHQLSKFVFEWCGMHGLSQYHRYLSKAIYEFKKMEAFFSPPVPAVGSDHRKHHIVFARVGAWRNGVFHPKTNFDAHNQVIFFFLIINRSDIVNSYFRDGTDSLLDARILMDRPTCVSQKTTKYFGFAQRTITMRSSRRWRMDFLKISLCTAQFWMDQ